MFFHKIFTSFAAIVFIAGLTFLSSFTLQNQRLNFILSDVKYHNHERKSYSYVNMCETANLSPVAEKKLPKVEGIKHRSNYLRDPLEEELENDKIFVNSDAVVVLKYHGSYMQDNRDNRQKGQEKEYQFMLRLKSPAGEIPPHLYRILDDLCTDFGQNDLRATTRQAFQIHGILKGNLKTVISTLIKAGSSTIGACGDVSRNVMCTPAPFTTPAYRYARQYSSVIAELFKPESSALTQLWLGDEKVADVAYWFKNIHDAGVDIEEAKARDSGTGIITKDPVEPLYTKQYLPRKFKVAITVPGDNSLDLYTNDIGLVVLTGDQGELKGFNVMVGGGMGRTHNKDSTFARIADHFGYVDKDDVLELCKAILATQRDHGNREVRPNARMKYLVHEKGIEEFRRLVEGYFGKKVEPWKELPNWVYKDWMGWHEQGDGKWFLGVNLEQGRVRDFETIKIKTALRKIVDELDLGMILTPSQSIIFKDVLPEKKAHLDKLLQDHGLLAIEDVDPLVRKSMACPAFPLCGLAVTEAERRMPEWNQRTRTILNKLGLHDEDLITRMTGCPNGCARPYMAELALVGDGPDMYQVWVGGSPKLTNLAVPLANKVKWSDIDKVMEGLFRNWKENRTPKEAFGDFCSRTGVARLLEYSNWQQDYKSVPAPQAVQSE